MAATATEREPVPQLDFKEIISINVCLLQGLGVIKPDVKSRLHNVWHFLRAGAILGFASMLASELMNMVMVIGDVEKMAESSYLTLTHLAYGYKVYSVYKYQGKVTSLINSLNKKIFHPKNMNQYRSLKSYIYDSKMNSKIFLYLCVSNCIFWAVYPLIDAEDNILPLPGWFPFRTTHSPAFEIAFVYQVIFETVIAVSDVSLDTFMSGLIMVVCAQLNILNDTLKNIREYAEMELYDNEVHQARADHVISPQLQMKMDEKLVQCVVHHRRILEFVDEVKFLFDNSILGQFIVSIVIIGVTFFGIMQMSLMSIQFFSAVLYLAGMLLEIFLLCYYGNEVIMKSMELPTSAYCSNWIHCSMKYKRNLLFFMTRTQRELRLNAGGFITLSLETFVKILKSSYSWCAFLNTAQAQGD